MYDDSYGGRGYQDDRDYYDERDRRHRAPPPPDSVDRGPPPTPPEGKKPMRVSYKCLIGMIIAIVAVVLIFIFMAYPWYSVNYSHKIDRMSGGYPDTAEIKIVYNMNDAKTDFKMGNFSVSNTKSYDDPFYNKSMDEVKNVMDYVYYFFLISIVFLIIAMVIIPIVSIGKVPHFAGMLFLLLALIFILIIPIYFYFGLPPAIENQFNKAEMGDEPINVTFKYNGDFMSSGSGTYPYEANDGDDEQEEARYELKWGPEIGFWLTFASLITIVVAQVIYSTGKADLSPKPKGGYGGPPPRDYYDEPPPPRRDYGYDEPSRRDYGPPRPMRDEDYDYIQPPGRRGPDYGASPSRGDYGRPPPRPPRRRRAPPPRY